jgi:hypothetical protein
MLQISDPDTLATFRLYMGGYWNQMGEIEGFLSSRLAS